MADTTDLFTVVKNTSGATLIFGFLGHHGKTLAANATYSIFGPLSSQPTWNKRKQADFERALLAGTLTLISTPRPIIKDLTADAAVANPTVAATAVATGGGSTGGLLAAGTYKVAYTFVNTWGESTIGASASVNLVVGATNIPRVTLPALPTHIQSINLYITAANASPDLTTLRRYATGITTTTKDMAIALPAIGAGNPIPPATNTTQAPTSLGVAIAEDVVVLQDVSTGRVLV